MSFAPFDFISAIISACGTDHLRRHHRLAVDACGAWRWLSTSLLVDLFSQRIKHLGPRAVIESTRKVVVNCALGKQKVR
jgi:hypothetical protein